MSGLGPAGTPRRRRLEADARLLSEHYPDLAHEVGDDGVAVVRGPIIVPRPDGSEERIEVALLFGNQYPKRPPQAFDSAGRWKPALRRHIEPNGRFCLSLGEMDDPDLEASETALLDYLADLRTFLDQQIVFDSLLRYDPNATFPGREWGHTDAYAEYAARVLGQEAETTAKGLWKAAASPGTRLADPCLCGSGVSIGVCHREAFKQLRRALRIARRRHEAIDKWSYEQLMTKKPDHD